MKTPPVWSTTSGARRRSAVKSAPTPLDDQGSARRNGQTDVQRFRERVAVAWRVGDLCASDPLGLLVLSIRAMPDGSLRSRRPAGGGFYDQKQPPPQLGDPSKRPR